MTGNRMAAERGSAIDAAAARPGLVKALRIVAPLIGLSVLTQAVFAGQGVFIDTDAIDIHGGIANLTLLLVVIQAGLVLFAGFQGRTRTTLVATSLVLLVLVIVQFVLGMSGRDGGQAAAWHIPNGVLIFGLIAAINSLVARYRGDAGSS